MDAETPRLGERGVHLAPLGYGYDRIVEPVRRYGADAVYLLADDPDRTADRGNVDVDAARTDPGDDRVVWADRPAYYRAVRDEVASFADVRSVPVPLRRRAPSNARARTRTGRTRQRGDTASSTAHTSI